MIRRLVVPLGLALLLAAALPAPTPAQERRDPVKASGKALQGVMAWLEDKAISRAVEAELAKLEKAILERLREGAAGVLVQVRVFRHPSTSARRLGSVAFLGAGAGAEAVARESAAKPAILPQDPEGLVLDPDGSSALWFTLDDAGELRRGELWYDLFLAWRREAARKDAPEGATKTPQPRGH